MNTRKNVSARLSLPSVKILSSSSVCIPIFVKSSTIKFVSPCPWNLQEAKHHVSLHQNVVPENLCLCKFENFRHQLNRNKIAK
jgi:hypothetical protein